MSTISDNGSLSDPDLQDLERRLTAVSMSPNPPQREQLLYACGHAAGRAEMGRRLRAMYVTAASLACVSASLVYALFAGNGLPTHRSDADVRSVVQHRQDALQTGGRSRGQVEMQHNNQQHLTAGTSYEQMLTLDRNRPPKLAHVDAAGLTSNFVLTPLGPPLLDDLWN